jgi:hypothetical protein
MIMSGRRMRAVTHFLQGALERHLWPPLFWAIVAMGLLAFLGW